MKIGIIRKPKELASALLTTLVICSILSMFVMYYLSLIDQQSYLSARSQVWNMAISISEAGIEDGLEEINSNPNYPNLSGDGWAYDGSCYYRSNTFPDGNSYQASIYTTNLMNPTVVCRSYVITIPRYARNFSSSFFAAVGVNGTTASTPVSRAVQVTCAKANLFTAALAVKTSIDLKGNGVYTDSFDSTMPGVKSDSHGKYNSSIYSGNHGDIGTNGGITNGTVSVGNANIYGVVHTGPNCPVTIGSQGGVGPHGAQATTVASAISAGYIKPDANFTFPDTTYPNTASYLPPLGPGYVLIVSNYSVSYATNSVAYPNPAPAGPVTPVCGTPMSSFTPPLVPCCSIITNNNNGSKSYTYTPITGYSYTFNQTFSYYSTNRYDHILYGNGCTSPGGNGSLTNPYTLGTGTTGVTNCFVCSSLSGSNIVVGNNIVLALPNGLTGSEKITWAQGASLLIYAGNSSVTSASISGNGYVNPNGGADSLIVFCPPSVTSFSFNGNGQFTGVFIAPNANIAMNGGGSSNDDFCGSLMVNSCTMNGHFSFHYDESLQNYALNGRFLISSWNEVK
ncbi:MAG TPA: hypothetical protein VG167_01580 [Verrucomicrobiae bacterium]|nr:hypothetical protein [Verrucomicrobiae bacterium]